MVVKEGKVAEVWFMCHEVWSSRNKALMSPVLRRVADTRHHWIITCDAHMEQNEFAMDDWVGRRKEAPLTVLRVQGEWTFGQPLTTLCGQRSENTGWSESKG